MVVEMGRGSFEWPAPEEYPVTLLANNRVLVTVQMTPIQLRDWAVGFLFAQGLIGGPRDLLGLSVDKGGAQIRARIASPPRRATAGIPTAIAPMASQVRVTHARLAEFQRRMQAAAIRYAATGGMHVAALFRAADGEMIAREDVGRHNTVDKVIGAALLAGWDPAGLVLLTSGRISNEMCAKAGRFGVGLAASRSAATDQAIRLAASLGMGLVGYLRPHGMRAYTGGCGIGEPIETRAGMYKHETAGGDTRCL